MLQKQKIVHEKKSSVPFHDRVTDKSEGKITSHERLRHFVQSFGLETFTRMYKKEELKKICKAYGITFTTKESKNILGGKLLPVIRSSSSMPHPELLNVFRAQTIVDDSSQRIILRLTRTS